MLSRSQFIRLFLASLPFVLVILIISWCDQVHSQEKYPTRPIDIIVPFAAGGSTDLDARLIASYMNKKWGSPVNVVNKSGGNGIPGMLEVFNASPDGYTLLADGTSTSSLVGVTVPNLPFKIVDRTFIASFIYNPIVIFVSTSSPFMTFGDFVTFAKKTPEKITWCMVGVTGILDFCLKQVFKETGLDIAKMKPVPVKGAGDSVPLVSGGHIMIGAGGPTGVLAAIKGNLIRGLLITSENRHPLLPDVPTSGELGYPKVKMGTWIGISGPVNMPSYVVDKWNKELEQMFKDPEMVLKARNIGAIPYYNNSQLTKEIALKELEDFKQILGK